MLSTADTQTFESARPRLLGLAYRILGSLADAEDAVQDAFLKWANADRDEILNPGPWLTTVCTRHCLDLLRSANHSRTDYVGAWLPEPVHTRIEEGGEASTALASSLKTAFLLMLERLTPKERAAYLLHDIFDVPYPEIAETLGMQANACRKLVSRAKVNLNLNRARYVTPVHTQEELLAAFQSAIETGAMGKLSSLLSEDVRLTADGGGKVPTLQDTLCGIDAVTMFLTENLNQYWATYAWHFADINGERGVILWYRDKVEAAVSFSYDETSKATHIYIVRNPDKLRHLDTRPYTRSSTCEQNLSICH